ncbi:MAG: hypothetical protein AMXMBFR72_21840 [Betaproteobacteria bacterium]
MDRRLCRQLTFDATSLAECRARLERLGARCIQPPHDEGFGIVASFSDPEGIPFELVELAYECGSGGAQQTSDRQSDRESR